MKMLGTFVLVPAGVWFNFHAFMDISLTSEHWDPFGDTVLHVCLSGPYDSVSLLFLTHHH